MDYSIYTDHTLAIHYFIYHAGKRLLIKYKLCGYFKHNNPEKYHSKLVKN